MAGKFRQAYCFHCTRATLISMEEDTSMEEPKVITIDDVIDSTVIHINDFPRPNSTLTRPLCILMIFLDLTRQ